MHYRIMKELHQFFSSSYIFWAKSDTDSVHSSSSFSKVSGFQISTAYPVPIKRHSLLFAMPTPSLWDWGMLILPALSTSRYCAGDFSHQLPFFFVHKCQRSGNDLDAELVFKVVGSHKHQMISVQPRKNNNFLGGEGCSQAWWQRKSTLFIYLRRIHACQQMHHSSPFLGYYPSLYDTLSHFIPLFNIFL